MGGLQWFVLATLAPFLWAVCNHIDKIILEKYFKEGGVGTLLIVSALASALVLPFLYVVDGSVFAVGMNGLGILVLAAILDVILLWAYLSAIQQDDSSRVVIFYQLVPVLGIVTGWLFLGEVVSSKQLIAMSIIIAGTSIISFEKVGASLSFKGKTAGYMLLACACWATELAIFKVAAIEENVWRSLFWKHTVLVILGIIMFSFVPKYRRSFLAALRDNSIPVLGANLLNEVLYIFGTISYGMAVMSAPVALVLLTETFQSIFVLVIAILVARLIPRFATERVEKEGLIMKGVAICITGIGTFYLLAP